MKENDENFMKMIKEITPIANQIKTTAVRYKDYGHLAPGIIDVNATKGSIKLYQKVLAVGNTVRNLQVGDYILINPVRYMNPEFIQDVQKDGMSIRDVIGVHQKDWANNANLPTYKEDDEEVLMLFDNDIFLKYIPKDEYLYQAEATA